MKVNFFPFPSEAGADSLGVFMEKTLTPKKCMTSGEK